MVDQLTLPHPPAWLPIEHTTAANQFQQALSSNGQRERWKYTPLQKAWPDQAQTISVDSGTAIDHQDNSLALPCSGEWWQQRLDKTPDAVYRLCQAARVASIEIPPDTSQTINLQAGDQAPLLIVVGAGAQLELNETLLSTQTVQDDVWLWLEADATVIHSRNNLGTQLGHCYRFLCVNLAQNASYHLHNHSMGSQLHRQDVHIECVGSGAHAQLDMANWVGPQQHLDQHVVLSHGAADSSSNQRIHTIAEHQSKVTFNGRIHIQAQCPRVEAHLNNRNLALSDVATINTKPELEIYTDDVACSHGATVGMLDPDQLFYFASRGVLLDQARQLLARGFLRQCIAGPLASEATAQLLTEDVSST